ncbi:AAA family ATPase [Clostridium polynesiense]|uniref:AAA family ATPase n=1 Tax=Clostridium polynesiense TaxID=1325933 RepID=UPI000AF7EC93|nr:AAA family ATPase [Clostridium polynesiense]
MKRELTPKEIIYNLNSERKWEGEEYSQDIEYFEILKKIEMSLSIKNDGFNLYIIDNYSKDKMEKIINYVKFIYEKYERPKDICYVTLEDVKAPQVLYLNNCGGIKLKEKLEIIQEIYSEKIFSFYNSSINKEKESVMEYVQKQRNIYIGSLMDMAKTEGFDVKQTKIGFVFIPLKEGMTMTEREYDDLELLSKDEIINRALKLKEDAEDVINKLKDVENESIQRVKNIFSDYLEKEMQELKKDIEKEFENDLQALDYLSYVCSYIEEKVVEKYSFSYEDDEESITEIIYRFMVNVLVDNSMNRCPPVIFEQDPNINNLIGNIEYENRNGVYSTDISLIKAGSILKANEGCIILRLNDLLTNPGGYYYLKKVLLTGKINLDYNKGYLEFISLSGLKPMEIEVKVKVLLLGDYESYDILYHHDEDFKNIFKIRVQYMEEKGLSSELLEAVNKSIKKIIEGNKLLPIKQDGIKEIVKRLSRKAGSRKKISFDINEVERLLILSNNMAEAKGKNHIEAEDIINLAYEKDIYEEETLDLYKIKNIIYCKGKKDWKYKWVVGG